MLILLFRQALNEKRQNLKKYLAEKQNKKTKKVEEVEEEDELDLNLIEDKDDGNDLRNDMMEFNQFDFSKIGKPKRVVSKKDDPYFNTPKPSAQTPQVSK